jgi:predicted transglutaminase-like cysteine proteinase
MKKPKLTPQEKAEIKLINRQWNEFIRRMKKRGAIVVDNI